MSSDVTPEPLAPPDATVAATGVGLLCALLAMLPGTPTAGIPTTPPAAGGLQLCVSLTGPGGAVRGARIQLGDAVATSDEAGGACLAFSPGTLGVEAEGLARVETTVRAPGEIAIALRPAGSVAGRVVDEAGGPLPGARISAALEDGGESRWTARTDDQGRFFIDTLPLDWVAVTARASGRAPVTRRALPTSESGVEIRFVLPPAATVTGSVRNVRAPASEPALVIIVGSGIWPARAIEVGADGGFTIEGVPAGVYELRARQGTSVSAPREGLAVEAGARPFVTLSLAPGAALRGRVATEDDGAAIPDAEVVIIEGELGLSPSATRTDDDGRFTFEGLRAIPHRLAVRMEGFVPVDRTVEPGAEEIEIELARAATVAGVVLDDLDHPVVGARIEVVGVPQAGLPPGLGPDELAFRAQLFDSQARGPSFLPSGTGELGVTLGAVPPIPLAPGAAPPSALLGAPPALVGSARMVSDDRGRFRVPGVTPGVVQLSAQHADHATVQTEPMRLAPGEEREDLRIVMPPAGAIAGRVVDGRGFPVELVPVQLASEREPVPRMAVSARDGGFRFDGVAGAVTLTALPDGQTATRERHTVEPGETLEIDLALEIDVLALAGRVLDPDGWPVGGARVSVRSLRARTPVHRWTESAEDGTFTLGGLPEPPYRLEVDHERWSIAVVDPVTGVDEELEVRLAAGAAVTGRVIDDADDAPIEGARVELTDAAGARRRAVTDADGRFEFRRLSAGDYRVKSSADGMLDAELELTLSASRHGLEDRELPALRLAPGGGLTGVVLDLLGDPVPDAEVGVGDPPDFRRGTRSGGDGRFALGGLSPGDVRVHARHPTAGRGDAGGPVRIRAGETATDVRLRLPSRFAPEETPAGPGLRTGVAVRLELDGGVVRIAEIVPRSRARRAGLRVRDEVLSVDDEPVLSAAHGEGLLRGPASHDAVVEIRRRGRVMRLLVPREAFVPPG